MHRVGTNLPCLIGVSASATSLAFDNIILSTCTVKRGMIRMSTKAARTHLAKASYIAALRNNCICIRGKGTFIETRINRHIGKFQMFLRLGNIVPSILGICISNRLIASIRRIGTRDSSRGMSICAISNGYLHRKIPIRGTLFNLSTKVCVIGKGGVMG